MPVTDPSGLWALLVTGTIAHPDPTDPNTTRRYVYQRCAKGTGNIPGNPTRTKQRRLHVIPADPRTPHQIALRQRIGSATAAWKALSAPERAAYATQAEPLPITGYNLFVRLYCTAHPLDPADYQYTDQRTRAATRITTNPNPLPSTANPTPRARISLSNLATP